MEAVILTLETMWTPSIGQKMGWSGVYNRPPASAKLDLDSTTSRPTTVTTSRGGDADLIKIITSDLAKCLKKMKTLRINNMILDRLLVVCKFGDSKGDAAEQSKTISKKLENGGVKPEKDAVNTRKQGKSQSKDLKDSAKISQTPKKDGRLRPPPILEESPQQKPAKSATLNEQDFEAALEEFLQQAGKAPRLKEQGNIKKLNRRDVRGKPYFRGDLDVPKAIKKIKHEYGIASSSSANSESSPSIEKPRNIATRNKTKKQNKVLIDSSSPSSQARSSFNYIRQRKRNHQALKQILRDLITLKQSTYSDHNDQSNEDLRKFLIARRRLSPQSRFQGIELFDPLTGGYIYEGSNGQAPGIALSDLASTSNSDRVGVVRTPNSAGPFAFGPRTPTRYPNTNNVGRPAVLVSPPRVTTGNFASNGNVYAANGGNSLLSTGGFTHVDVGTGFGPIPPELCKDYYPYCQQIIPSGFCTSDFYPLKMKREFCPMGCALCS
uniref:ShKT domain-containing protein n=1 Tax=Ditylenchus dipsaci TaxID=166011 RepID=A0A915ECM3_9BILA